MTVYLTREGADRLHAEIAELRRQRPLIVAEVSAAAAQGDRSENAEYIYGKKKLREIDRRLRFLVKRFEDVVIVEPAARVGETKVFFGATVTVEDEDGVQKTYTLVGRDEIDAKAGRISFESPMGRALLGKKEGDVVTVRRPIVEPGRPLGRGPGAERFEEVELTLLAVRYGAAPPG